MLGLNLWDAIDPEQAGYTIPAQPTAPPMAVPAQTQPGGIGGLLSSLFGGGQRQPTQGFEGIPQREEPTWRERISTILSPALMQIGAALMSPPAQRAAILGNLGSVVQAGQKTLADDRLYRAQLQAWQKANTQQARSPSEVEYAILDPEGYARMQAAKRPPQEKFKSIDQAIAEADARGDVDTVTRLTAVKRNMTREPQQHGYINKAGQYVPTAGPVSFEPQGPQPTYIAPPGASGYFPPGTKQGQYPPGAGGEEGRTLTAYDKWLNATTPEAKAAWGAVLEAKGWPKVKTQVPGKLWGTNEAEIYAPPGTPGAPAATAQQPISREEALAELRRRGVIK